MSIYGHLPLSRRSRLWAVRIVNPENHGITKDYIIQMLREIERIDYWSISYEKDYFTDFQCVRIFIFSNKGLSLLSLSKRFHHCTFYVPEDEMNIRSNYFITSSYDSGSFKPINRINVL